jgi:hypothetical protein
MNVFNVLENAIKATLIAVGIVIVVTVVVLSL